MYVLHPCFRQLLAEEDVGVGHTLLYPLSWLILVTMTAVPLGQKTASAAHVPAHLLFRSAFSGINYGVSHPNKGNLSLFPDSRGQGNTSLSPSKLQEAKGPIFLLVLTTGDVHNTFSSFVGTHEFFGRGFTA